uniref:Uncharacterized protein n=1 Tax=viral metagenome TaxID=1070528 RepID=A0A2V0R9T3_9ZZZZ
MMKRVAVKSKIPEAESKAQHDVAPEDQLDFATVGKNSFQAALKVEEGEDLSDADRKLISLGDALAKANYADPVVRDALSAACHVAAIAMTDATDRGFDEEQAQEYGRYGAAFSALLGINMDKYVQRRAGRPYELRMGVTWHHPHFTVLEPDISVYAHEKYITTFEGLVAGLGRITSLDETGAEAIRARTLFDAPPSLYYEDTTTPDITVLSFQSRLQTYDLYYRARERLVEQDEVQFHKVAVGLGGTEPDLKEGDDRERIVLSGGRGLRVLRGADIPANLRGGEYTKVEMSASGEKTTVLELFAAKTVRTTFPLQAAFGHPRTLAEVAMEQAHVMPTASNRIIRFCRRIDALIGVGRDPTVLVQFEWNIPAEVLRTLVEERVRIGRPLTFSDLTLMEDALMIV